MDHMNQEFFEAVQKGDCQSLKSAINQDKSLLIATGPGGWPALHLASYFGHLACLETLLLAGGDIEMRSSNENRNTPLHAAVAGGQLECVQFLITQGADLNATYVEGTRALHEAAFLGRSDIAEVLLAAGADPNARKNSGETPSLIAAQRGHAETAQFLTRSFR